MATVTAEDFQGILRQDMIYRLIAKLESALSGTPLDLDFLRFTCRQELYLWDALSRHATVPPEIVQALHELHRLVMDQIEYADVTETVETVAGDRGRPRYIIERERLAELLEMNLSVDCIAKLLGISASTVNRRMREFDLSIRQHYSNAIDQELDEVVQNVKNEMPTAGYRIVKGRLKSLGIHVEWRRLIASRHRVDSLGILSQLTGLGCIVRRVYSVRGPLSLLARGHLITWTIDKVQHCTFWCSGWLLQEEDLFAVHLTFLPKLKADLEAFVEGWNNHPLRSEGGKSPEQIWRVGMMLRPIDQPENLEDIQEPDVDWDAAADYGEDVDGVLVVPDFDCPLNEQ